MPHVLPPVWLFFMKPGKKLWIHAWSWAPGASSSNGTIASSSISVNMSVDRRIAVTGGSPLFSAVSALTIVSW